LYEALKLEILRAWCWRQYLHQSDKNCRTERRL